MILITKWFGVFLCEDTEVRRFKLFEKEPKLVARKLAAVQRGEILPEERELAVRRMKVADPRLKPLGKPMVFMFSPSSLCRMCRENGLDPDTVLTIPWGEMNEASQALFPGLRFPLKYTPVRIRLLSAVKG